MQKKPNYLLPIWLQQLGLLLLIGSFLLNTASCKKEKDTPNDEMEMETEVENPCDTLGTIPSDVFAGDKAYTYRAVYTDVDGNEISNETVRALATGKPWQFQPGLQVEVQYIFEENESLEAQFSPHPINPTMNNIWETSVIEGVISKESWVWIHPIRHNQYIFTEVAPFPEVLLPVAVGNSWGSELSIISGWGEWDNTTGEISYTVTENIASKNYNFGTAADIWVIESTAVYPFGTSTLTSYYNDKYGFLEMHYTNYVGEILTFVMEDATYKYCDF